jgi:hypothetical protein
MRRQVGGLELGIATPRPLSRAPTIEVCKFRHPYRRGVHSL